MESSDRQAWSFLAQALDLSVRARDNARIQLARRAAFQRCREQKAAGVLDSWCALDNLLWAYPSVKPSSEELAELLGWMEESLDAHVNIAKPVWYAPHRALEAAERMRRWCDKLGQQSRSLAALEKAGIALEALAAKANALTAVAWLEDLSRRYRETGLTRNVVRVDSMIRERSERAAQSMSRHEIQVDVAKDDVEAWLEELLAHSLSDSLDRIAVQMMSSEGEVKKWVETWAANAPLLSMVPNVIRGDTGFRRATIGPVKDDMPGRIIGMGAMLIGQHAPWLSIALERAKEKWGLDAEKLVDWLAQSALYPRNSHALLRAGADAWMQGDWLKAIHLLVPQIEAALREWLMLMGESPMRFSPEADGFESIGMGTVLHTESFKTRVDPALRLHLRALYADPRGLNLRNRIAHGLASPDVLGRGSANLAIHSLLAIRVSANIPSRLATSEAG